MKKIKSLITALIVMILISACSSNDETPTEVCDIENSGSVETIMFTASDAYIQNPTNANCIAFRTAMQDYINTLGGCTQPEVQARVQQIRDTLQETNCN